MAKRKNSEVEMIGALKQMEAGRSAAEVGRELGVSKHTIYQLSLNAGDVQYFDGHRSSSRTLQDYNPATQALTVNHDIGNVSVQLKPKS